MGLGLCLCASGESVAADNLCAIFNQCTERGTGLCLWCCTVSPPESRRIYREHMSSVLLFKSHSVTGAVSLNVFTITFVLSSPRLPVWNTVRHTAPQLLFTLMIHTNSTLRFTPQSVSRSILLLLSCRLKLEECLLKLY